MNTLCLPLLRDAERLDLLNLEPPRAASKKNDEVLRCVRRPLDRDALQFHDESARRLLADWRSLACARKDAASLSALLRVLAMSVSSEATGPAPSPGFGGGRDLRPWLSDRATLRRWLVEMRTLWRKAVSPLACEGLLPLWTIDEAPAADGSFCLDVFAAARFDERSEMNDAAFASIFAVQALPFVPKATSWRCVREMECCHLSMLALVRESPLFIRLVEQAEAGVAWMKLLLVEPAFRAQVLLAALVSTGVHRQAPAPGTHRLFTALRHLSNKSDSGHNLVWALGGLRRGVAPQWLAGALRLAKTYRKPLPDPLPAAHAKGTGWIVACVKRWDLRPSGWWALRLWHVASLYPGMKDMVGQLSAGRWSESHGATWMGWIRSFHVRPSAVPRCMNRWKALRAHWPELLRLVERTPVRRRNEMLDLLRHGLDCKTAEKDLQLTHDTFAWAHALLKVYEMDVSLSISRLVPFLPCFDSSQRLRIAAHLPALMTATKKLGGGWNFGHQLDEGVACIPALGRRFCLFVLLREPKQLIKTLARLGTLKSTAAERVVFSFASHPIASCDPESASLKDLAVMIEASSHGRQLGMPVKRRTWDHVEEIKALHTHLLTADCLELQHAWARLAMEVLHELIDRELRLLFPMLSKGSGVREDTLLYLHTLDEQCRKARRVVRSAALCLPLPREHHPANRRWLRTMPSLMAAQWSLGLHWTCEVPKLGRLTFETERDPVEVLRMGDYASSCLGAGSCNQFSALTNALDGNKHVVYARNAAGRVVGRQLLAVSEAQSLVCFDVYPGHASDALKNAFARFDHAFAEALALPLHKEGEYKITSPLGLEWYDDGAWTPWSEEGNQV